MSDLLHRIRIFVYRYDGASPNYLLVRGSQGIESFWGPLHGPVGFGEQLETAIRREVMDHTGIARPGELIDLQMPLRWLVGDEEVIEWSFGFRAPADAETLLLDDRWAAFRWEGFAGAYPQLELEFDRAAIMRLHTLLAA